MTKKLTKVYGLTSSFMLERGDAARLNNNYDWNQRENLNAWMYGAALTYEKWHIGGSYSNYGKSLYLKQDGTSNTMKVNKDGSLLSFDQAYFYDFGIGYSTKDRGVSLTYFASRYLDNTVSSVILSFDRLFSLNDTMSFKAYIEGGYAEITHGNFLDSSNNLISGRTRAALVFTGLRFML